MPSKCERAIVFQYVDFNMPALCRWVSKLRGGQRGFGGTSQVPVYGSFTRGSIPCDTTASERFVLMIELLFDNGARARVLIWANLLWTWPRKMV